MIANIFGDIARSVILAIVGWIEYQLVTLQRDQHTQLVEANKQLRKYALANEKLAQTQERNRLARELHDTLAHTLSSVSVQLEAIKALFDRDPTEAKNMLGQTIKNTKNGLTETRRTLVDLRSSELENYGLTQAIRNMGNSAAERSGFKISFHLDKGMDVLSPPGQAKNKIDHQLSRSVIGNITPAFDGQRFGFELVIVLTVTVFADRDYRGMLDQNDGITRHAFAAKLNQATLPFQCLLILDFAQVENPAKILFLCYCHHY